MDKLGEQAGNRSPQALGEIETPKGDISGELSLYVCLCIACTSSYATIKAPLVQCKYFQVQLFPMLDLGADQYS